MKIYEFIKKLSALKSAGFWFEQQDANKKVESQTGVPRMRALHDSNISQQVVEAKMVFALIIRVPGRVYLNPGINRKNMYSMYALRCADSFSGR